MTTPVRKALLSGSTLREAVRDGLGAVATSHRRDYIDTNLRDSFDDSMDLDAAVQAQYPNDPRWDYLLGHGPTGKVFGLEPHSAHGSEVSVVIQKRARASQHLRDHLADGARVAEWFWVASGRVDFLQHEKALLKLQQEGITFVGKRLLGKHLAKHGPSPRTAPAASPNRTRR